MSYTSSATSTYSVADVENVFRRFSADLKMIADSTGGMTREEAEKYGSDIAYLAASDYLKFVDLTLFSDGVEEKAVRYTVNTAAGELTTSRPGGVLWPRVSAPDLRVVIQYTQKWYDLAEMTRTTVRSRLKIPWGPTNADISHSTLTVGNSRAYVSSSYGLQRQDYSK